MRTNPPVNTVARTGRSGRTTQARVVAGPVGTTRCPHAARPRRALVLGIALFVAVAIVAPLSAQTVFRNPQFDYIVDIPAGWQLMDGSTADIVSFADPERTAVFQIMAFPGDQFVTVEEMDRYIRERFGADGDVAPFRYLGQPSRFADYRFSVGQFSVRGYMVFVNRDEFDVAVMTYVPEDAYPQYHDLILSAVDSFSPDAATRNQPGPVSQFFSDDLVAAVRDQDGTTALDGPGAASGAAETTTLTLPEGTEFALPATITDPQIRDAHQVLIEREARVLSAYAPTDGAFPRPDPNAPPEWVTAWRRYFRMIYRDSFDQLEPVAEALFQDLARAGVPRDEMPARILSWLQGATYQRTQSLSDLLSPASCLVQFAGDCDSLGITYAILLHHLGFDAILMASVEYSHAMVGVDIPGDGARFPFQDRQWLVAELTDEVPIGRIAQDMSDIGGWIGVKLDPTVQY